MAPKKFWKSKNKYKYDKRLQKNKNKRLGKNQDARTSARLAIEGMTSHGVDSSSPPVSNRSFEPSRLGQASARTSPGRGSPWHDPFHSYIYPPTSLNFQPPFDTDGSHLVQRSPGLTEHEGKSVEILAPMMAPGHDQQHQQQQRNQQQPLSRSTPQQPSNQQRLNVNPNGIPVNGEQQQRNQNAKDRDTERDQRQRKGNGPSIATGPMQSHIQVAKPYVFQQAIEGCLKDVGVAPAREDNIRLAGVQWIDNVRRALKLPVRTFDTAVVYYHKFRLVHSDGEYSFVDAAAAALFAACKIEDTLKKSRDILCAAHNLKVPRNEQLSPDDTSFEHHSRSIIGLERLMLEASSFDFRNRHPQTLMIKLAKFYNLGEPRSSPVVKTAYAISLDLYRTFAPLKQSTATLAFACLELAIRVNNHTDRNKGSDENPGRNNNLDVDLGTEFILNGRDYRRWGIKRAEVMETLLDLLELYTHYKPSTTLGPDLPIDTFLEVRIPLNEELDELNLPRFTEYIDTGRSGADPAGYAATMNGVSATATAANGAASATNAGAKKDEKSPTSPSSASGKANGIRQKAGERGREGTVRFMLNPDRERQERMVVAEYHPPLQPQSQGRGSGQIPSQPSTQPPTQPAHNSATEPGSTSRLGSSRSPDQGSGPGPGQGPGPGPRYASDHRGGHRGHGPGPRPGSSHTGRGGMRMGSRDGGGGGDMDHRPSRR